MTVLRLPLAARPHRPRRIRLLREHRLFSGCSDAELGAVARNTTQNHVAAGDALMRQGHVGREFIVVMSGRASVIIDGQPVATLGPGDFVGEMALLDRTARTATVVADTDLVVLVSGVREFTELLLGAPNVARAMLRGMAERLRHADRRVLAS